MQSFNVCCCSQAIEILVDQHISDQQAEADNATVAAAAAAAAVASASAAGPPPSSTSVGADGYREGSSEMMCCTPTKQGPDLGAFPELSPAGMTDLAGQGPDSNSPADLTTGPHSCLMPSISDSSLPAFGSAATTEKHPAEAVTGSGGCREAEGAAAADRAEAVSPPADAAAAAAPPASSPAIKSETKRTAPASLAANRRKTRHQPPRNRNCVCGSGRKFKICCGSIQGRAIAIAASVAPDRQLAQLLI